MHREKSPMSKHTWKEKACAFKCLKKHNMLWKQILKTIFSTLPQILLDLPQTLIFFFHKPKLMKLGNYFTDTCWRGKKGYFPVISNSKSTHQEIYTAALSAGKTRTGNSNSIVMLIHLSGTFGAYQYICCGKTVRNCIIRKLQYQQMPWAKSFFIPCIAGKIREIICTNSESQSWDKVFGQDVVQTSNKKKVAVLEI